MTLMWGQNIQPAPILFRVYVSSVELDSLVAGTRNRGDFEEKLRSFATR